MANPHLFSYELLNVQPSQLRTVLLPVVQLFNADIFASDENIYFPASDKVCIAALGSEFGTELEFYKIIIVSQNEKEN